MTDRKTSDILRLMKVPEIYRDMSFDTFEPERANWNPKTIQRIRDLAKQRRWIIICGTKTGTGKTRLAVCAMLESFQNDTYEVKEYGDDYETRDKCIGSHKQLYNESLYHFLSIRRLINISDIRDKAKQFEDVVTKRIVLLDEMGREKDKWVADQIDALTFGFEEDCKQVIGTAGMSAKEFRNFYDESLMRRIEERGEIIEF